MADHYYLVSSLPMLSLDEPALITSDAFLASCADWLTESAVAQLSTVSLVPDDSGADNTTLQAWYDWETCLRNRMARNRAADSGQDIEEAVRHENDFFSEIERGVQEAYSRANPLEREKALDRLRWQRLEDQESGHPFDLDRLIVYRLKLLLIEKWSEREQETGAKNVDSLLDSIYQARLETETAEVPA